MQRHLRTSPAHVLPISLSGPASRNWAERMLMSFQLQRLLFSKFFVFDLGDNSNKTMYITSYGILAIFFHIPLSCFKKNAQWTLSPSLNGAITASLCGPQASFSLIDNWNRSISPCAPKHNKLGLGLSAFPPRPGQHLTWITKETWNLQPYYLVMWLSISRNINIKHSMTGQS